MTQRKPAKNGEMLTQEIIEPMGLTQGALAEAMGVQRNTVNKLVQQPQGRDSADGAYPRACVR